ncbi:MAG: Flp family type IVb pilin [Cypionkella sp.]
MKILEGRSSGRHWLYARDDRGATAVEYALMASLIAVVVAIGVTAFGLSVRSLFEFIVSSSPFFN